MKKRILTLLLALTLALPLGTAAAATAGSAQNPLITLSYIRDTFLPAARAALERAAALKVDGYSPAGPEKAGDVKLAKIPAGGSIELTSGQELTVISGVGRFTGFTGNIVNVTVGYEAGLGRANNLHRYIICGGSSATVSFSEDSVVSVSSGVDTGFVIFPFTDVSEEQWYYNSVYGAYEKGLVSGMTDTTYEPLGTLTVAQAIRLATAMYQLWYDGEVTLKKSDTGEWYESFVAFAYEKGIIDESYTLLTAEQYNAAITRSEFVHIFYSALPEENYGAINDIPDGAIPDVAMDDAYADEIYTFYRAGIVSGYTDTPGRAEHSFGAGTTINRAEVASILNRMFDSDRRASFTIETYGSIVYEVMGDTDHIG